MTKLKPKCTECIYHKIDPGTATHYCTFSGKQWPTQIVGVFTKETTTYSTCECARSDGGHCKPGAIRFLRMNHD
jgi:hypothetical protein